MENPIFDDVDMQLESFAVCSEKITIETVRDHRVIYERRIGSYGDLSSDWCAFLGKYKDYMTGDTVLLERTYDDPSITDTDECLYDICMSMPDGCDLPNIDTIKGGKFAIYHFKGLAEKIYCAYQSIFIVWLPIVYLYLAVGLMISVGGLAIAGMALGGQELKKCNDTFNQKSDIMHHGHSHCTVQPPCVGLH